MRKELSQLTTLKNIDKNREYWDQFKGNTNSGTDIIKTIKQLRGEIKKE